MATRTFKIGEYCKGGVITAEVKGKTINVIAKDWDVSAGYNKGSNQSKAKEFDRETNQADGDNTYRNIMNFLEDLTTHYYACQVMEWIESKVEIRPVSGW